MHEKVLPCLRQQSERETDAVPLPGCQNCRNCGDRKTGSYLTIEPKQGCIVPAAVWSVSERDELALDRYEGYPHFYYKTELELPLAETGKKLTAFVYIMHEERKLGIPTSAYIRTCVDGYRQFGFDLKHLRKAMDISEREVYHHENG